VRIAFDSRPLGEPHGVGRYTRCLLQTLRDTADAHEEIIETNRPRRADVFHSPWMQGAMLHSPCPMVVTLHDLAVLKRRSAHRHISLRLRLRELAVQRAVHVIVPTEALAADAVAHLGLEREHIAVIPEAPDAAMYPRSPTQIVETRERFGLPERYLAWVGCLRHPDPCKHVGKLAATPRELPLVLVGPTRPWAHELPDVTLTGRVSDEDLAAIYSGAQALVLASDGDAFGLPAVEALACGTPVVACDGAALREVLEGRATFVQAGNFEELIRAAQVAQRPAPPPPSWSWEDAATATRRVYEKATVLSDGPRTAGRGFRRRPAGEDPSVGPALGHHGWNRL
jgi:glycosyltransferase involved in cell wall biosynthesis